MSFICYKIKRLLNRFVDNELSDEVSLNTIKEHLQDCPGCKKELDYLQMVKGLMSKKEKIAAGEDFLAKLKEKLKPEPQIIKLRWVTDMGILSKKLIPASLVIMIFMMTLVFGRIDSIGTSSDDIFGALTNIDTDLVDVYFDSNNVLDMIF